VTEVVDHETEGHIEFPDHCPECGAAVEREGPLAFCPAGFGCPAQLEQATQYYASREALDIEGLGEERVAQLIENGLVEEPADLYELSVEELATLDGWGERSAQKRVDELDATRNPPLADFVTALGIPDVGSTTARELATYFGTFEGIRTADEEELREVSDIGPAVAASIRDVFDNERTNAVIDRLLEHVEPQAAEASGGDELAGETFVFTGSLDQFTRSEAQELVDRHGGSATSSVSGNTDYLVAGDNPGQTKQQAAAEEDVPILSESEFLERLQERGVDIS
jgi:DNA ligase (NAD+)